MKHPTAKPHSFRVVQYLEFPRVASSNHNTPIGSSELFACPGNHCNGETYLICQPEKHAKELGEMHLACREFTPPRVVRPVQGRRTVHDQQRVPGAEQALLVAYRDKSGIQHTKTNAEIRLTHWRHLASSERTNSEFPRKYGFC